MRRRKNKQNNIYSDFQTHHVQPGCPAQARLLPQLQATQWLVHRRGRREARGGIRSLHLPADLLEAHELDVQGRVPH